MRVALLARVSTVAQAAEDRHSLPAQLGAMRDRCTREGWEIVREFHAPGESAFTANLAERPVLLEAVRAAEAGDFDILMIHESSRLARKARLHFEVTDRLTACGVRILEAGEPLLDASPETGMIAGVKSLLNQYWSEKMSEHIRKGYTRRHALGLPTGDLPFGYAPVMKLGEDGHDVVDTKLPPVILPDEGEAVRAAFASYAQGRGYLAIATDLNRGGFRPRSKRGLTAFTASSVRSLIENRFYAGFVSHRGDEAKGAHEAILTEEEWVLAVSRVRKHQSNRSNSYGALLSGMPLCRHCGGPVWSRRAGEGLHHYYWEPSRVRGRTCAASGRNWRAADADALVADVVKQMHLQQDWLDYAAQIAAAPKDFVAMEEARRSLMAEKDRATKAFVAEALPEAEWKRIVRRIDLELADMPVASTKVATGAFSIASMAEAWEWLPPASRNKLLRTLFVNVQMDVVGREIWVEPAEEFVEAFKARRIYCAESNPDSHFAGSEPSDSDDGEAKCGPTPDRTRTCAFGSGGRHSIR